MRSLLPQGGTFSADRAFCATLEVSRLLYDFALKIGGRSMKSLVVKHSVIVDGHKTSISLEAAFWTALKDIAHERRKTLKDLISSIDADRQSTHLSSVLRVFILEFYKVQFARHAMFEQREISVQ
jgi:predicted DNA-binding ribbon-helix-helix protein